MSRKREPIPIGERFGRLVIVRELERDRLNQRYAELRCDCGAVTRVRYDVLRRPNGTRSCGCILIERNRATKPNLKHGEAGDGKRSPEYIAWHHAKTRCTRPSDPEWKNYGGRGIIFCARWESFERFLEDVGRRPSEKHSLDRIDNSKGYEPGNVRWATASEQNRNRRGNVWVEIDGVRMVLKDWAARFGIPYATVRTRIRSGLSAQQALSRPVRSKRQ